MFEDGPLGIVVIDADFRFIDVNPAFCDLLGYSRDELRGRQFAEITHPDDIEKVIPLARQSFSGEAPSYRVDQRYVTKSGATVWASLKALRTGRVIPVVCGLSAAHKPRCSAFGETVLASTDDAVAESPWAGPRLVD